MQLLSSEIVVEARELSLSVVLFFFVAGVLLWIFGWRWHRFWMGMAITVLGGLAGLQAARASGTNLLAFGLLLAISAGTLALELSRILAFLGGGMSVWLVAYQLMPMAQGLWIGFLIGGLLGVLLFRLWMMLLTSFVGVLLTWHAGFVLLERQVKLDAPTWIEKQQLLIQIAMVAIIVIGLIVQSLLERWHLSRENEKKLHAEEKIREEERERMRAELPLLPSLLSVETEKPGFWRRRFGKAG